jgi:hypothetical protein
MRSVDQLRDPADKAAKLYDARLKLGPDAMAVLQAIGAGRAVQRNATTSLLMYLRLVDPSLKLTNSGLAVLAKYPVS